MDNFLFLIITSLIIVSFMFVLYNYNPIYSIFFLILGFINVSGLFILLTSDFIALIFLLIYVGAVSVLFLFIIMMVNIKRPVKQKNYVNYLSNFSSFIFIFILFIFVLNNLLSESIYLIDNDFVPYINWFELANQRNLVELIGLVLYSYYFYYFIIVGLILLLAMIGSIILTIRHTSVIETQYNFEQSSRQDTKSVFLVYNDPKKKNDF